MTRKVQQSGPSRLAPLYTTLAIMMMAGMAYAQNPIVRDQFTADPSARVFGDKVYVFPSHDIPCTETKGRIGWFCMEDYHVFSSENLTDWTDHGVIVTQNEVPWVRKENYAMWAPDCIERDGKFYFYFPTFPHDTTVIKGFTIGVAVADKPEGPYTPEPEPIANVRGIDPNVFIDKDGQAYLYWSAGHIYGAKLKANMLELDSEVKILGELPDKGLKEGPYVIERNGIYYMTYPHVENKTERLEYAIGDNPLGPFKFAGVIMDESPTGCWTNHHSMIEFKGQWYLFYHHNDYSPKFDKNRSIRIDSLFFNDDGTIRKVIPTLRGVGITPADKPIQIDRYSAISGSGVSIAFIDTLDTFKGWKTVFEAPGAWLRYNSVDFGAQGMGTITAKVKSAQGGKVQFWANGLAGKVLAEMKVKAAAEWTIVEIPTRITIKGVNDLWTVQEGEGSIEIDWLQFK